MPLEEANTQYLTSRFPQIHTGSCLCIIFLLLVIRLALSLRPDSLQQWLMEQMEEMLLSKIWNMTKVKLCLKFGSLKASSCYPTLKQCHRITQDLALPKLLYLWISCCAFILSLTACLVCVTAYYLRMWKRSHFAKLCVCVHAGLAEGVLGSFWSWWPFPPLSHSWKTNGAR